MSAIAALRGDQTTPYFAWLFALPFCMVAMLQDEVVAVALSSFTTLVGAIVILIHVGVGGSNFVQWSMCVLSSAGLSVVASAHLRRHRREEYTLSCAALDALKRLAESEKRNSQADRMALVGQLAAGVAHEINNPLAFVTSNLQFLEEELTAESNGASELRKVMAETQLGLQRIKGIVGDLTAFSRDGGDLTNEVDLQAVVVEAARLAMIRTKGRIGVLNELPQDLRRVLGNQRYLVQVFLNLFINASDALESASMSDGKIWIRATTAADGVQVDFDDNGPGFSDAALSNLFQPFFTTKSPGKGTGLGLATSREHMLRMGGDLLATKIPSGGARFTLRLRCAPAT